ncbi:hypothetical protein LCGC14_0569720 [marine sediment metagenome]|uniref:Uncharacterized protein n=1 Tax=marine sediment metagenome TaxID=412755 RepID=A0A0F9RJF8_9ZZZZ
MGDDKEVRITQMKMVMLSRKSEQQRELEKLRHKNVMEGLKFMADNKINSYNIALSDTQLKRIKEQIRQNKKR